MIFVVSEEMGVKIVNIQLAGGHTLLNKEVFRFHSFIHVCKNDKSCKDATFLGVLHLDPKRGSRRVWVHFQETRNGSDLSRSLLMKCRRYLSMFRLRASLGSTQITD